MFRWRWNFILWIFLFWHSRFTSIIKWVFHKFLVGSWYSRHKRFEPTWDFQVGDFSCLAFSKLECLVHHKEIRMAQHYLLSSKSKTIDIKTIFRLTEEEAFHLLKAHRWGNPDNIRDVCCPHCGIRHEAYFLTSRKRWCCKHCKRHFYITTNTAFTFHKLALVDILIVISMMVNSSKGISAIDVSRHLNLN